MSTRRPSRSSSEENSCWAVHTRYLVSSAAACHFKEQRRRVSIPNRQQHGQTLTLLLLLFLLLSILLILEDFALPQPLYNQPPSPVPHQTALLLGDWRGWIGCPHPRWQSLSVSHTHTVAERSSPAHRQVRRRRRWWWWRRFKGSSWVRETDRQRQRRCTAQEISSKPDVSCKNQDLALHCKSEDTTVDFYFLR